MIYFLVNNDYHYIEAENHAKELRRKSLDTSLIVIPHTLRVSFNREIFPNIIKYNPPNGMKWLQAWWLYVNIMQQIKKTVFPESNDKLVLFTEYEILNHLVSIKFKKDGASVYLLEDCGLATYLPLSIQNAENFSIKEHIKNLMIQQIPYLRNTNFTKIDGEVTPLLNDSYLDGICLYRDLRISRKVPLYIIKQPHKIKIIPCFGRVVFLNQPIYNNYIQSRQDYTIGIRKLLKSLLAGFDEVYFKFHPRESEEDKAYIIANILSGFPGIKLVESNAAFELMLSSLKPEVVASYSSAVLWTLSGTGVQPLFLFHLLEDLMLKTSFRITKDLLGKWNYNFPLGHDDVAKGFHAGKQFHDARGTKELSDLLK